MLETIRKSQYLGDCPSSTTAVSTSSGSGTICSYLQNLKMPNKTWIWVGAVAALFVAYKMGSHSNPNR